MLFTVMMKERLTNRTSRKRGHVGKAHPRLPEEQDGNTRQMIMKTEKDHRHQRIVELQGDEAENLGIMAN